MWIDPAGLPGRPWFRNLYAATDRHSGYATAPWPLLREAIEDADSAEPTAAEAVGKAVAPYLKRMRDLRLRLEGLARSAG
jgi:N-acetylated-alpha-linked acidic dipeptidase